MKTKRLVLLGLMIAAAVLLPISCDLPAGVSIGDRIALFQGDLNVADRSQVYLNFHPTETADYGAITGDPTNFDTTFPLVYQPYTITIISAADPTNVTATIDAAGGGFAGPYSIVFKMAQLDQDWMIEELDFDGGTLLIQ